MLAYIKLATMEYPRYEGDIRAEHPEIPESATYPNFPCPPTYAPVEWVEPPQVDFERYTLTLDSPAASRSVPRIWRTRWKIEPIPDQIGAERAREKRNKLLVESDWTQLADSPVNKTDWATYRQALRDISLQSGFPWDINWPVKPE